MASEELARAVVLTLSQYLNRRAEVGNAAFNAQLEGLLGQLEAKMSDPFLAEVFARFVDHPSGVEADTLRLHLVAALDSDGDFARQVATSMGGQAPIPIAPRRKRVVLVVAAVAVVLVLGAVFVIVQSGSLPSPTAAPAAIGPATTAATTTETTTTTTVTSSSTPPTTTSTPATPLASVPESTGLAGDGSTLAKGTPVFLTALPRPNDEWSSNHGDHDVQLTAYQESLWSKLVSCDSTRLSRSQRFRLKGFNRIEVKAVGTDSTSDPAMTVKFEVFVNADEINPIATIVANPGESKPLVQDLPAGTFALMLRASLPALDKTKCREGNAVWGSPYVIAAGK